MRPTSAAAVFPLRRERTSTSCCPGTIQANPGINPDSLRQYKGYGVIRLSENAGYSKYNSFQLGVDRRYTKGFSFGLAYTLGKSEDNGSDKRTVMFNTQDDSGYWGASNFDRRHVLNFHYIYDLPFLKEQNSLVSKVAGGWQISGSTFMRSGTPLWVTSTTDVAGVGDAFAKPYNQVRDPSANANRTVFGAVRQHGAGSELLVQPRGVCETRSRNVRQRTAQQHLQPRSVPVGHLAVQERPGWAARGPCSSGRNCSTS